VAQWANQLSWENVITIVAYDGEAKHYAKSCAIAWCIFLFAMREHDGLTFGRAAGSRRLRSIFHFYSQGSQNGNALGCRLVQTRLLHDPQKFSFVDLSIAISIRLVDHLLQLFVGQVLPQLFGDALEVFE